MVVKCRPRFRFWGESMRPTNKGLLKWKVRSFSIGSCLGLAGIFMDKLWISMAALLVLMVGYGVGYYRYEYRDALAHSQSILGASYRRNANPWLALLQSACKKLIKSFSKSTWSG